METEVAHRLLKRGDGSSFGCGRLTNAATDRFTQLTISVAITTGIAATLAGLLRLGFLANYISEPVLNGFIVGLALAIIVGQLPKLFVSLCGPRRTKVASGRKTRRNATAGASSLSSRLESLVTATVRHDRRADPRDPARRPRLHLRQRRLTYNDMPRSGRPHRALDRAPDGCRAMNDRASIKVLVNPS